MSFKWEGRDWIDATNFHSDHSGRVTLARSIYSKGKFQNKKDVYIPSVKLISLSTLADFKAPFLFHTSNKAWDMRLKCMLEEMKCFDPDFICLQDVDRFSDSWCPSLMLSGYDAVYKPRTEEKELHEEGVAIAVRRNRFRIIKTVFIEFNQAVLDDKKGSVFRDRCKTDDVGILVFVQPKGENDLPAPLCVATLMFNAANSDEDIRNAHIRYFVEQIEYANREFHAPVLIGANLSDYSGCMSYMMLRTGRQALAGQVPPRCRQPAAFFSCRTSALIQWDAPQLSIADPAITSYRISWRTGGSASLGYHEHIDVSAGDCIAYTEIVDEKRNRRVVPKEHLQYIVTRLCAEVAYEFRVCGVNKIGPGPWSEPSMPIILPNPAKATPMPKLTNFLDLEDIRAMREEQAMAVSDFDINLKTEVDFINGRTQLTPRTIDGIVNEQVNIARVLPMHCSARAGWRQNLYGQPDSIVMDEVNRDYVIKHSILRDNEGFKEKKMDKYDDLGLASTYSKNNRVADMAHGRDGSTLLIDAKDAMYHIGGLNHRQQLHLSFRSAYDSYSSSGEPIITSSLPPTKLLHTTECLDYIFYSEGSLVVSKVLTLPSWQTMRCGANPEASQAVADYNYLTPFSHVIDLFDMQLTRIMNKIDEEDEDDNDRMRVMKMVKRSHSYSLDDVKHMKRLLTPCLNRSHGSNPNNKGSTKPKSGNKSGRAKSPPPRLQRTVSTGTGLLGPDYSFFGGRWAPFAIRNPARSNYYLPAGSFGSTHMCLGAEFLIDDSFIATTYSDVPV